MFNRYDLSTEESKQVLNVMKLIRDYINDEFHIEDSLDDLYAQQDKDGEIGLAYTTVESISEDCEYDVQTSVDVYNKRINYYIDNELVDTLQFDSFTELKNYLYDYGDFDTFISDCVNAGIDNGVIPEDCLY